MSAACVSRLCAHMSGCNTDLVMMQQLITEIRSPRAHVQKHVQGFLY